MTTKSNRNGIWVIKNVNPPPATNGIEVFSGKKDKKHKLSLLVDKILQRPTTL